MSEIRVRCDEEAMEMAYAILCLKFADPSKGVRRAVYNLCIELLEENGEDPKDYALLDRMIKSP